MLGFIPTEAYPAGLALDNDNIYVSNLKGEGARLNIKGAYNTHHMGATVSIIPIPKDNELPALTTRVEKADFLFRTKLTQLLPRTDIKPKPLPDRIGEPSLIKHVLYIIKENRTYDQVMGDMPQGNGLKVHSAFTAIALPPTNTCWPENLNYWIIITPQVNVPPKGTNGRMQP